MGLATFIPTVWSARLSLRLEKSLVYGQANVVNRDYEGEIRDAGDSVRIGAIGPVTIGTYTRNNDMDSPEALQDASQTLIIDQSKYFNFQVDDVDRAQSKPEVMDAAMGEAAYGLADTADQYIAGLAWQSVPSGSTQGEVGTGLDIGYGDGETNPYVALLKMAQHLDENNVPREGRWAVVPPWFHAYLLMDDRFVQTGSMQAEERLGNGLVGQIAGFKVMMSNNVPYATSTTEYKIVAGTNKAISYAEQISKVEAYRPQLRFADAVKGLHLYGAKVVRPEALALLIADVGTVATA